MRTLRKLIKYGLMAFVAAAFALGLLGSSGNVLAAPENGAGGGADPYVDNWYVTDSGQKHGKFDHETWDGGSMHRLVQKEPGQLEGFRKGRSATSYVDFGEKLDVRLAASQLVKLTVDGKDATAEFEKLGGREKPVMLQGQKFTVEFRGINLSNGLEYVYKTAPTGAADSGLRKPTGVNSPDDNIPGQPKDFGCLTRVNELNVSDVQAAFRGNPMMQVGKYKGGVGIRYPLTYGPWTDHARYADEIQHRLHLGGEDDMRLQVLKSEPSTACWVTFGGPMHVMVNSAEGVIVADGYRLIRPKGANSLEFDATQFVVIYANDRYNMAAGMDVLWTTTLHGESVGEIHADAAQATDEMDLKLDFDPFGSLDKLPSKEADPSGKVK